MKIVPCKQGEPDWVKARLGLPTASDLDQLVSASFETRTGAMPHTYLCKKLCERVMGFSTDFTGTFEMQQGSMLEHEAKPMFTLIHDVPIQTVGFITTDDGRVGASPDGLIGTDCGIECKAPSPEKHLQWLLKGTLPAEHAAQVHGSMWVTGRSSWWFMSYSRQFPPLMILVQRDAEIQAQLTQAIGKFLKDFDNAMDKLTALKAATAPRTKDEQW